jgi:hypothetical protein
MEASELERRYGQASQSPYTPHLGAHLQAPQVTINRGSGGGGVFEEPLVQVKKKHPSDGPLVTSATCATSSPTSAQIPISRLASHGSVARERTGSHAIDKTDAGCKLDAASLHAASNLIISQKNFDIQELMARVARYSTHTHTHMHTHTCTHTHAHTHM